MVNRSEKATQDLKPDTAQFKVLAYLAFRGPSPSAISSETGIALWDSAPGPPESAR
jgi:hypothetical protein